MPQKRVAVAMSGGVDSSVAAALLKQAGYEVSGVHARMWPDPELASTVSDLENTCRILDIPLHQLDMEKEFRRLVVDYFIQEYSHGRTPNPCIVCNQHIKLGLLMDRALEMGAEYMATGHYARIEPAPDGYRLLKAADESKDQTYFLYTLGQRQLEHLLLPLGELRKEKVRNIAGELGLPAVSRSESQDICFIPGNDYRAFIAQHISFQPGDIIGVKGKVMGQHEGLAQYTVGQRQGLGLTSDEPLYVIELDAANNRLVVGSKDQLLHSVLLASELSWVSGKAPAGPINIMAKVRYKAPEVAAELYLNNGAELRFVEPQQAIAPGQSVVFYQEDAILGGGIIDAVLH
ncbi:MAG: tRNA 2-thiouridine(34) synthase MnmA [Deltaproteobacteria bacterium]|nr:tRNA 2-thiouridine(34) synthase MnmA [Deltaproteobacteria bacterium]